MASDEMKDEATKKLVRWSSAVLKAFRSGHHPTFDQLDKLELALKPFTTDKLCGHGLLEECDCLNFLHGVIDAR